MGRARPNLSPLDCAGSRMGCEPHWDRLSHVQVGMKASNTDRLGGARLLHPSVRADTEGELGQVRL